MTLDGFRVPKDPHPDEPDEQTPDTLPIDDLERPHSGPDEEAHEHGVDPAHVKRRVGEGGELDEESDRPGADRP